MVFSDLLFLFEFLAAFALCYLVAGLIDRNGAGESHEQPGVLRKSFKGRNLVTVIFSLIFYAWGEPVYVFLMIFCVFVNYLCGISIDTNVKHKKLGLVLGIIFNLAVLGTFKYLGFFADILGNLGLKVSVPTLALPIGISFYTFQSMSYLIDVYRKESPPQKRFLDLLFYISMFPQLIAGPIVRYGTIAEEIGNRKVTWNDFAEGSYRFLIGLGKKVIIANQISTVADYFLAANPETFSTAGSWIGLLAFTFQIYYDFSGYSDMAIGLGRCLGFHFNENFDHPYISTSITEFWRRWHISLGSFFRDYLYIPLGGNRRHQALNILIVWFLTGMWHGASWNFILWGVYFGIIVMIEKYTILKIYDKIPKIFLHLYSIFLFTLGWGIFYFDDLGKIKLLFSSLFGNAAAPSDFTAVSALSNNFWLWIAALLFAMPIRKLFSKFKGVWYLRAAVAAVILIFSVALLVGATNNPFLYFRF